MIDVRVMVLLVLASLVPSAHLPAAVEAEYPLEVVPQARLEVGGVLGGRIERNSSQWLLRAPAANPGLLAMFEMRDRQPTPELVPWAGEFVGKYLTSGSLALRLDSDPRLRDMLSEVVRQLIDSQADDGYLGPFRRDRRLLENWDLWGHYHIMLGLMLWEEATQDPRALEACRRAADLMCRIYLDGSRRVIDARSPEMNLSVLHGLALLYERTHEPRYLELARAIVQDFERAGDYLRTGLSDLEFYETPSPRWESLHCLQGLVAMYRITGEAPFREAFLHHWSSILRYDRRNTGGFSSGEQATGDPYADSPIETCCSVAWSAISLDALTLTGDPRIADELELTLFNALAGAQHPSGSWWTYDTPMNGRRAASAHAIVFQARPGTPELNCCSVNGPRGLGMVAQWALMRTPRGIAINFWGPLKAQVPCADGAEFVLEQVTDYPRTGDIEIRILAAPQKDLELSLRVPAWAVHPRVAVGDRPFSSVAAGAYHAEQQTWRAGDRIRLRYDMPVRWVTGTNAQTGRVSLYRGPILLAHDQESSALDESELPALDLARVRDARLVAASRKPEPRIGYFEPWLLVEVPTSNGKPVVLSDFASAGCRGGLVRSWLRAEGTPLPLPAQLLPRQRAVVAPGAVALAWTPHPHTAPVEKLIVAADPGFHRVLFEHQVAGRDRLIVEPGATAHWPTGQSLYWKLQAADNIETIEFGPPRRFSIAANRPAYSIKDAESIFPRSDGLVLEAALHGDATPSHGFLGSSSAVGAAPGLLGAAGHALALDGKAAIVRYQIPSFPQRDYTAAVWLKLHGPQTTLGQVLSAWCAPGDDPLRLCVEGQNLFARIEGGSGAGTQGIALESGRWYHAAVVKRADTLTLFVDGRERARSSAPLELRSAASQLGVGGNPEYTGGPEFLAADVSELKVWNRALDAQQIRSLADRPTTP